jgi:PST family polysaccharide transporter
MSNSYRQIFKSTALIGGTQVINIFLGIVRTKVLAILLGPSGMGIAGLYQSSTGLVGTLAGLGIGSAGVRQIAEAVGTGDEDRIARTVRTLRLTSALSGLLGMLVIVLFCGQIGYATFGNASHTFGVALMSLTLLFGGISAGQTALLQGMRRLKHLASCQVLGVAFGTVVGITLVYFLRERGIAPYLVAVSGFGILSSWWYARKVRIEPVKITAFEIVSESKGLLNMGLAFMVSGLLMTGTDYVTRVLISRQLGMNAVGLYSATWTLSSLYVGVILNSMGADFYPRLTAAASDDAVVNRLVNEQTEMGILIAIPGILVTLTLAPWVLRAFYSEAFVPAADVIRWQILGVALRVVSWPMSFVQLGKGMSKLFMLTETVFAVVYVSLMLGCMKIWGLEGVGISFFALYVSYSIAMLGVCNRITGFSWSRRSLFIILSACCAVSAVLLMVRILPVEKGIVYGLIVTAAVLIGCLLELQRLLKIDIKRFIPSGLNWVRTKM